MRPFRHLHIFWLTVSPTPTGLRQHVRGDAFGQYLVDSAKSATTGKSHLQLVVSIVHPPRARAS